MGAEMRLDSVPPRTDGRRQPDGQVHVRPSAGQRRDGSVAFIRGRGKRLHAPFGRGSLVVDRPPAHGVYRAMYSTVVVRPSAKSDRPIVPPTIFPTPPVGSHVALVLIHCTTISTKQTLFLPLLCPCASCCLGHEPHSSPPTPTSELAKCTALSVPHRASAAKSSLPEPPRAPPRAPSPSTTDCPCCCLHELRFDV
jgi:hypothetical protein